MNTRVKMRPMRSMVSPLLKKARRGKRSIAASFLRRKTLILSLLMISVVSNSSYAKDNYIPRNYYLGVNSRASILPDKKKAVTIMEVAPGTPAEKYGMRPGFIVTAVNQVPVTNEEEFTRQINASDGKVVLAGIDPVGSTFSMLVPLVPILDYLKTKTSLKMIFEDTFDHGAGQWPAFGDHRVQNGRYVASADAEMASATSGQGYNACRGNCLVEVEFERLAGAPEAGAGIHIGAGFTDPDYVFFLINREGKFTVLNYTHKTKKRKIVFPWSENPAILRDGSNTVAITRLGDLYAFYVNGREVANTKDVVVGSGDAGIAYHTGTIAIQAFRVYSDAPVVAGSDMLNNFFNAAPQKEKDITLTAAKVIPSVLRPGGLFDLEISTLIKDSAARGSNLEFTLTYSIKQGEKILLTKTIPLAAREGVETISKKQGMKASASPGTYALEVTVKYGNIVSAKNTSFTVQ